MNLQGKLRELGVWFGVDKDGDVAARCEGKMPDEAKQILFEHKDQIKKDVYHHKAELIRCLKRDGICYINSDLGEVIALTVDDYQGTVKAGVVKYSVSELALIADVEFDRIAFCHVSKKTFGGVIVGNSGK